MRFRPCIDIRQGKVTQIVGSSLSNEDNVHTNFNSDLPASYYAQLYRNHNLTGGHVIKLGPEEENNAAAKDALLAWPDALQIGGGITLDNARYWLELGASHLIITSFVFRQGKIDFQRLESLKDLIGSKKIVLDLSCRKQLKEDGTYQYVVVTDRWAKMTEFAINQENLKTLMDYCDEFLIHGVDVEGKKQGIESELVELLGNCSANDFPMTYAGGVSTLEDLERIKHLGNGKIDATIGSALDIFGGNLAFTSVLDWSNKQ